MILIISTCSEKLHDLEFVKPIEKIIEENKIPFKPVHYSKLNKKLISSSKKIIICGTSLKDNKFLENLNFFLWIKSTNKPILGICAGMQIISLIFGSKIKNKTEIGYYKENFTKKFLELSGKQEVYHLHNKYTNLPKKFTKYTSSKTPQAIKHNEKEIYGVLFHPEVRNKKLIEEFIKPETK
jgi:GMP synthase (glutamine-hydrolysing)